MVAAYDGVPCIPLPSSVIRAAYELHYAEMKATKATEGESFGPFNLKYSYPLIAKDEVKDIP